MAANVVKLRETSEYIAGQGANEAKRKAKAKAKAQVKTSLKGKTFDELTGPEKDDLLKALAIQAGLIEE
jgi:hypothetical protein